jgi:hypothetical protein
MEANTLIMSIITSLNLAASDSLMQVFRISSKNTSPDCIYGYSHFAKSALITFETRVKLSCNFKRYHLFQHHTQTNF